MSREPINLTEIRKTQEFLIFRTKDILFATTLLSIKEIIRPQEYKHVPNTKDYFLGMVNLRGIIVALVDLRKMLHIKELEEDYEAILVFEGEKGTIGAVVDEVLSVTELDNEQIESPAAISSEIPTKYLKGVANTSRGVVNLIDLSELISCEIINDEDIPQNESA